MLTEYIFELMENETPKLLNIVATTKEEAEKKLKARYGEQIDLKLLDLRRLIY